jgi:hypothetical protein
MRERFKTELLNKVRLLFRHQAIESFLIKKHQQGSSIYAKFFPSNHLYPKPSIRVSEINKIKYSLDISDYMEWLVYFDIKDKSQDLLTFPPKIAP